MVMDNNALASRHPMHFLTFGLVGMAVLLIGSERAFALPTRLEAGKTYCSCSCETTKYSRLD